LSLGLQIGGDISEAVFVVRSQRGLKQFYESQFKLGTDIGVAAGPMVDGSCHNRRPIYVQMPHGSPMDETTRPSPPVPPRAEHFPHDLFILQREV
jgi:hypothetical protein